MRSGSLFFTGEYYFCGKDVEEVLLIKQVFLLHKAIIEVRSRSK